MIDALKAQWKGDRLMKKNSTVAIRRKQIFKGNKLTIGMDLGNRFTYYCVLDEAGEVMVEQRLPTTRQAHKRVRMEGWRQRRRSSMEDHSTNKGNYKTCLTLTGLVLHWDVTRIDGRCMVQK
jgi:hypothetical protein